MMYRYATALFVGATFLISGCGDGAPTNADIRNAIEKKMEDATKVAGNDPTVIAMMKALMPDMSKYEIKETKCTESGRDSYDCIVTAVYMNQTESKQMKFVRLRDGWSIVD